MAMSQLSELILFINQKEMKKLETLALSGRERTVWNELVKIDKKENIKKDLMKKFKISSDHYDKIQNILLNKVYDKLAGKSFYERIDFLRQKMLFRHLFHEIKIGEKNFKSKDRTAAETEEFFKEIFDLSITFPAKYFNEKKSLEYCAKYLATKTGNERRKLLYVKSQLLYGRLKVLMFQPPFPAKLSSFRYELLTLEKDVKKADQDLMRYIYRCWIVYYTFVDSNPDLKASYIGRYENIINEETPDYLYEIASLRINRAEVYYACAKYTEAEKKYRQAFDEYPEILKSNYHQWARLAELYLINEKPEVTKEILNKLFTPFLKSKHETHGVLAALISSKLYLYCKEYKKMKGCLDTGKNLNSKSIYFNYEMELRMLDNIYFALQGKTDYALEVAHKNLRFISTKKISLKRYHPAAFFKLLIALLDFKQNKKELSKRDWDHLHSFANGFEKLYGIFLLRLIY